MIDRCYRVSYRCEHASIRVSNLISRSTFNTRVAVWILFTNGIWSCRVYENRWKNEITCVKLHRRAANNNCLMFSSVFSYWSNCFIFSFSYMSSCCWSCTIGRNRKTHTPHIAEQVLLSVKALSCYGLSVFVDNRIKCDLIQSQSTNVDMNTWICWPHA